MTKEITFADRIGGLTGSVAREILSRTELRNVVSFAGGLPDASIWDELELPRPDPSSYQYGPSEGDRDLRILLAERVARSGVQSDWMNTLILSGSQQGLDLLAKLFLMKGRTVIVERPTYLAALQVFRLFEAKVVGIPMDAEGMDPEALRQAIMAGDPAFIYLNPTFQNPTGICYSSKRREEIAAIVNAFNVVLVEDDPYRDLNYDLVDGPRPIVSMVERNWVYLNSVSKILMPGLRIGSLSCSSNLFDRAVQLKQAADLHTSRVSQSIAFQLLHSQSSFQAQSKRVIDLYRVKRDALGRSLNERMADHADWVTPSGGMFFWLRLKKSRDLRQLMEACLERGVAIMPGDPFIVARLEGECCLRLNFTSPKIEEIDRGIEILVSVIEE